MNPQLQAFFDGLRREADLARFVKERREEDLYLEFKQKRDGSIGDVEDDDRKGFSKSLSAFANADGGILIFGIATKKTPDHPDQASALKPITGAERFRAKLLDLILNTTQPPVDGIQIEVIAGRGGGYVKCLIPASDLPPHRAMHADREYWRRVTIGCRRMDHYELEDIFGRRLRPVLRLVVVAKRVQHGYGSGFEERREVTFHFRNEGRGVARHPGMLCRFPGADVVDLRGGLKHSEPWGAGREVTFYDPAGVIHPTGIPSFLGTAMLRAPADSEVGIEAVWYAENAATRRRTVELPEREVVVLG